MYQKQKFGYDVSSAGYLGLPPQVLFHLALLNKEKPFDSCTQANKFACSRTLFVSSAGIEPTTTP